MSGLDFSDDVLVVTGGSGFVGKSFLERLDQSRFKEVRVIRSKDYDLRDPAAARRALRGARLVVHIAGITGGIEYIRRNQGSCYYDNLTMTTNVIHEAMVNDAKKVVVVGTVCSYPKVAAVPFREDDIWGGYPEEVKSYYGMAKKMAIVQGEAYRNQYGLNTQVLLFTSLYGPGDHFEKERSAVVPALIGRFHEAIAEKRPSVTLWGDGTPTRDLLYVGDAVEALFASLHSESSASPLNIGAGEETSIKQLAETLRELMGGGFSLDWDTTGPNGQARSKLDTTRALQHLGFKAGVSLKEGLRATIDWYLDATAQRAENVAISSRASK